MKKICLLIGLAFFVPTHSFGQSSDRIIDFFAKPAHLASITNEKDGSPSSSNDKVLELVEVKVEDRSVKLGEYFTADDSWLKTLTVKVRNISSKPISRVVLMLGIPEAKYKSGYAAWWLIYSSFDANTGVQSEGKLLKPNETAELTLNRYEAVEFIMKETGISTIKQIIIASAKVDFKDGSYWSSNRLPLSQ